MATSPPRRAPAIVTLLALVAGLGVAELVARAREVRIGPRPALRGAVLRPSADPALEFENVPGAQLVMESFDARRRVVARVPHTVNAAGWRGPLARSPKPDDTLRVACIGDSQMFGFGVGDGQTFTAWLQRAFDREDTGARAEVLNFAVSGYDGLRKLALLEGTVLDHAPDVVLLQLFVNDTLPRSGERTRPPPSSRRRESRSAGLASELRLLELLGAGQSDGVSLHGFVRRHEVAFAPDSPEWKRFGASLVEAAGRLAERRVRLVVFLYPLLFERDGALASRNISTVIEDFLRTHGVEFVDLAPAFRGRDLGPLLIHPTDYHLSGAGHGIAAGAVFEHLISAAGPRPR